MNNHRTVTLTNAALMTALAIILSYFPEIPLAFFAPWLKLDFSFTPLLLLGFTSGLGMMVPALIVTNLVHIIGGTTGGPGELANILVGLAFLVPPTLLYRRNRTRKTALVGMLLGVALMVVVAVLANRYILLPAYFGANFVEKLAGANLTLNGYLFAAILPFNLIKGLINSFLVFMLYKRLSVILKEAESDDAISKQIG